MEKLILTKKDAKKLYERSDADGKKMMEEMYGKETFSDNCWTDLFKEFCDQNDLTITHQAEKARTKVGYVFLPHESPQDPDEESDNAYRMIKAIIKTEVDKWNKKNPKENFPDYNNPNQYKYEPIFDMSCSSGFGFSDCDGDNWGTNSHSGSRLCMPSWEICKEIAVKYTAIYEKFMR